LISSHAQGCSILRSPAPDLLPVSAKRHELHKRALGHDKPSLDLTDADFDAILAVFSGISRPADLNTLLRLQEQAPARATSGQVRATELLGTTRYCRAWPCQVNEPVRS
jgi:hypothetical protein